MTNTNMRKVGICQVCGIRVPDDRYNCSTHLNTRKSSLGLARYIHRLDSRIPSSRIKEIAAQFDVSTATVYNHLKREGFISNREWRQV